MESLKHTLKSWLTPLRFRIRSGPLKGYKWAVASGSKFIKGNYEPTQTALFMECVKPGDVVFDVGAHVGYYTALASLRAGAKGRVIAFEPRPLNLRFLHSHIHTNRMTNVTVFESCVGESAGEARFDTRTGTGTGHMSTDGELSVKVVALDDLVREGKVPQPNLIKMDVEGAELSALAGAETIIRTARPTLLISTHGPVNHAGVLKLLADRNYSVELIQPQGPSGDAEVIARPR